MYDRQWHILYMYLPFKTGCILYDFKQVELPSWPYLVVNISIQSQSHFSHKVGSYSGNWPTNLDSTLEGLSIHNDALF